jgi:hypothetical protein
VRNAIDRGELPEGSDIELALDMLAGPLYWRMAVVGTPVGDDYLDRLTDKIISAMKA